MITRTRLDRAGLVMNPHMWIGDGWFFCRTCSDYTRHYAMSHPGQADCWEVCGSCETYSGKLELQEEEEEEEEDEPDDDAEGEEPDEDEDDMMGDEPPEGLGWRTR